MADARERIPRLPLKPGVIAIAVIAAALGLAACGGDDDGDDAEEAAPTTETTEATTEDGGDGELSGEQVFLDTGCGDCHTLAAAGTNGTTGPDLDETAAGESADEIRNSIVNPNDEITDGFGPNIMPSDYGDRLSGQELDALAQYIAQNAGS